MKGRVEYRLPQAALSEKLADLRRSGRFGLERVNPVFNLNIGGPLAFIAEICV